MARGGDVAGEGDLDALHRLPGLQVEPRVRRGQRRDSGTVHVDRAPGVIGERRGLGRAEQAPDRAPGVPGVQGAARGRGGEDPRRRQGLVEARPVPRVLDEHRHRLGRRVRAGAIEQGVERQGGGRRGHQRARLVRRHSRRLVRHPQRARDAFDRDPQVGQGRRRHRDRSDGPEHPDEDRGEPGEQHRRDRHRHGQLDQGSPPVRPSSRYLRLMPRPPASRRGSWWRVPPSLSPAQPRCCS